MLTIAILLCIFISIIIYSFYKTKFRYWSHRNIPYLKSKIPFGNHLPSLHVNSTLTKTYNDLKRIYGRCTPCGGLFVLWYPIALAINLKFIKSMFNDDFEHFHDRGIHYNESDSPLSAHLVNLSGKRWQFWRTKLLPSFSSAKLKSMFRLMQTVGDNMCNYLSDELANSNGSSINVKDIVERYNVDVIGSCAFGIECNSFTDRNSLFLRNTKSAIESPKSTVFKELLGIKSANDHVMDFFWKLFRETVKYREENDIRRDDLFGSLMDLKREHNDVSLNDIAAQSYISFTAGYSSSSALLSFCVYELAVNREIQRKLRQEICSTLEAYNGDICYEAVAEMTYLHQVLNGKYLVRRAADLR